MGKPNFKNWGKGDWKNWMELRIVTLDQLTDNEDEFLNILS